MVRAQWEDGKLVVTELTKEEAEALPQIVHDTFSWNKDQVAVVDGVPYAASEDVAKVKLE